jgi:hypothetical protein
MRVFQTPCRTLLEREPGYGDCGRAASLNEYGKLADRGRIAY